ncbi:MAG: hypothetical protein R3B13_20910 [Polyangiaceae bacterium]
MTQDDFEEALRDRLEQVLECLGQERDIDEAFDVLAEVDAEAGDVETGRLREWQAFELVLGALEPDFFPPPFDAVLDAYGSRPRDEPLDSELLHHDLLAFGNVQELVEQGTVKGCNDEYGDADRELQSVVFEVGEGEQLEVKLVTRDAVQTFTSPIQVLDALLAIL